MKENAISTVNEFGNVDLTRTALPKRYVHVSGKRLQPICKKLKIKYCEAVVGFSKFKYGYSPVKDGVVVARQSLAKLNEAIAARETRNAKPRADRAVQREADRECVKRHLETLGINDPNCRTAKLYLAGKIDAEFAALMRYKVRFRHEYTDYDARLSALKSDKWSDARCDARSEAEELDVRPANWDEYLALYDFPFPEVADQIANVLRSPEEAHPVWFCEAVLAVQRNQPSELTYESIVDAITKWREELEYQYG